MNKTSHAIHSGLNNWWKCPTLCAVADCQHDRHAETSWCCTRILNIKCEASLYIAYTEEVGAGGRTEWVYTKSFCLWWGWAHAAGRRGRCAFYLLVALLKHADAHTEHAILDARSFPHVSYICSCVANMQSIYGLWMNKGCTQKHKQQRARLCISKRPTNKEEGSEFGCLNIWRVSKLNCGLNEIEIVAARVLVKSLKCCQHHPRLLLPNVKRVECARDKSTATKCIFWDPLSYWNKSYIRMVVARWEGLWSRLV